MKSVEFIGNTEIAYHENLLSKFNSDHQKLLRLFNETAKAAESSNESLTKTRLRQFSSVLQGHVLEENVKLYVYLDHALKNDKRNHEVIIKYKSEMQSISKLVNKFVLKYVQLTEWEKHKWESFESELKSLGDALVARIESEESILYPLYLPPAEYRA